jgi:signal transduction histidine kinase
LTFITQALLDNAYKYADERSTVRLDVEEGAHEATITVHNTGQVLPTEVINRLFKPFSRADSVETYSTEGAGLGLYLSRTLASRLGGTLELQSSGQEHGTSAKVTIRY